MIKSRYYFEFSNFASLHVSCHHRLLSSINPRIPLSIMDYVLTPVVLDNGSGMIKAGYAGEEIPKSFFPS